MPTRRPFQVRQTRERTTAVWQPALAAEVRDPAEAREERLEPQRRPARPALAARRAHRTCGVPNAARASRRNGWRSGCSGPSRDTKPSRVDPDRERARGARRPARSASDDQRQRGPRGASTTRRPPASASAGGRELEALVLGDRLVGHLAAGDVEPEHEAGVRAERAVHAVVGELEDVGHRRVGQRPGRRDRHRAGHVGHAVVRDAVDLVGRVRVRRRARGLEAAALVDRDVDEHRVALHQPELLARDDVRRAGAGDQHGADDEVGLAQVLLDRQRRGEARVGAAAEGDVELAQAVDVAVEDRRRRPPCRWR